MQLVLPENPKHANNDSNENSEIEMEDEKTGAKPSKPAVDEDLDPAALKAKMQQQKEAEANEEVGRMKASGKFDTYFKMLGVGVPPECVVQKMGKMGVSE